MIFFLSPQLNGICPSIISLSKLSHRGAHLSNIVDQLAEARAELGRLAAAADGKPTGVYGLDATHGLCNSGHVLFTLLRIGDDMTGVPVLRFFLPHDHTAAHLLAVLQWLVTTVPTFSPYLIMTDDCRMGTLCMRSYDSSIISNQYPMYVLCYCPREAMQYGKSTVALLLRYAPS